MQRARRTDGNRQKQDEGFATGEDTQKNMLQSPRVIQREKF